MFLRILIIFAVSQCVDASQAEANLYRTLLKNYSAIVRPVRNPNRVLTIKMKVFLQQILNVDEQNQVIEVNAWLKYIWYDYRLRWRPVLYDNITSVRFSGEEQQIWQPDILLYNSANERFDSTYKSNLVVYSSGLLNWIPPGIFKITCKMDITMFPFDEQVCFLKFGSWTYHGFALDLRIEDQDEEPSMDTSTFISNGEWQLLSAPAEREVTYYQCCPEPYPTIKFHMHLKRRALYHIFNIITPSLLISGMTLLGFCLPAHDMSEKIGFQTTILLSVCFFLTILSEMTPTTSESIPLLGIFFSSVTLIVAMSTTFTVCVLNVRYRQYANTKMSPLLRLVFMEFIPWLLLMKRPGYKFSAGRAFDERNFDSPQCVQCALRDGDLLPSWNKLPNESHSTLCLVLQSIPGEKLELSRKVGEGLFVPRKCQSSRRRRMERCERYMNKCRKLAAKGTPESQMSLLTLDHYVAISRRIGKLRERLDHSVAKRESMEDWKFAALVLDRLCLCMFAILFIMCTISIFLLNPAQRAK